MPIDAPEIERLLREGFPDAEITVQGDDGAQTLLEYHSAKEEAWRARRASVGW